MSFTLSQAIQGYTLFARARRLSPNTIAGYQNTYNQLLDSLGDPDLDQVTPEDIQEFLAACPYSKRTTLKHHIALSALWSWAVPNGIAPENIITLVGRPKPEKTAIIPFEERELRDILDALTYTLPYARRGKKSSRHLIKDADRNRAIILVLLDTGLRATELCDLLIKDCDFKNLRIHVDNGKGDVERYIPFSARTGTAIWKYLSATRKTDTIDQPLFITKERRPLDRKQLLKLLNRAGKRAGVPDVHPHRFRHTFSINYLRNGGDIYTLQIILGHASLDMVKVYLALAQVDLDKAHRRASPVENMRL